MTEAVAPDELAQKIEVMIRMLAYLTSSVKAMEDQQREEVASPTVIPSISCPIRRRVRCQLSTIKEPDLSEEVRQRVTNRIKHLPGFTGATIDEDTTSNEEPLTPWHQQLLRSGLRCTGASMVVNKVTLPHSMEGKPAT